MEDIAEVIADDSKSIGPLSLERTKDVAGNTDSARNQLAEFEFVSNKVFQKVTKFSCNFCNLFEFFVNSQKKLIKIDCYSYIVFKFIAK